MSIQSTRLSDWEVGPLLVKPKTAWKMLGCGNTHGYALLKAGELVSFLDGRSRKITVDSIHRYIARRIQPTQNNGKNPQLRRRQPPRKATAAVGAS
jgi:hypothetical protein